MISTRTRPRGAISTRRPTVSDWQHACVLAFHTELNWMAVAWRDDTLGAVVFGHPSRPQAEAALLRSLPRPHQFCRFVPQGQPDVRPPWIGPLIDSLQRFAAGEPVDFSDVPLAMEHLSPFARRVVAECRRIPWGQTRTYGELAAACGSPGAARAVGSVMAKNRYPLVVPCHRVVGAAGSLGGYSAPAGLRTKRRLLEMETARLLQ